MDKVTTVTSAIANDAVGDDIYALASEIFPLCRSISGDGVRQTLDMLSRHLPIERRELPTGTPVLDWTVPAVIFLRDQNWPPFIANVGACEGK